VEAQPTENLHSVTSSEGAGNRSLPESLGNPSPDPRLPAVMPLSSRASLRQFDLAKKRAAKAITDCRRSGGGEFDNPGENELTSHYNALVAAGADGYQYYTQTGSWPSASDATVDAGQPRASRLSATRNRQQKEQQRKRAVTSSHALVADPPPSKRVTKVVTKKAGGGRKNVVKKKVTANNAGKKGKKAAPKKAASHGDTEKVSAKNAGKIAKEAAPKKAASHADADESRQHAKGASKGATVVRVFTHFAVIVFIRPFASGCAQAHISQQFDLFDHLLATRHFAVILLIQYFSLIVVNDYFSSDCAR